METKWLEVTEVYEKKPRPEAKEGERYILIRRHTAYNLGDVLTLFKNDGTDFPKFIKDGDKKDYAVYWHKLIPYPSQDTTDGQLVRVKKPVVIKGIYS